MLKAILPATTFKLIFRALRMLPLPPQVTKTTFNGHEVIDVHLTDQIIKKAIEIGVKIRKTRIASGSTPIIRASEFQHIFGAKCQFAFFLYAFGDWVEALDYMTINVDKGDVTDAMFRGYSIDVKGTPKRSNRFLMTPEKQWRKKQYDFYIGCNQWDTDVIRVWGYATKMEMEKTELQDFGYGPTRAILLRKLHPIKELLKLDMKLNPTKQKQTTLGTALGTEADMTLYKKIRRSRLTGTQQIEDMTDIEAKLLAQLIDTDGAIETRLYYPYQPFIRLTTLNARPACAKRWGGMVDRQRINSYVDSYVEGEGAGNGAGNSKIMYSWRLIDCEPLRTALLKIEPYLKNNQHQAQVALKMLTILDAKGEGYKAELKQLKNQMNDLNNGIIEADAYYKSAKFTSTKFSVVKAFAMDVLQSVVGQMERKDETYQAFVVYCQRLGLPAVAKNAFSMLLPQCINTSTEYKKVNGERITYWRDIKIKPE